MKAVIPAAGRGRRLGGLTDRIPKPLLTVGGRPVLARVIDAVAPAVEAVVVVAGYRAEAVRNAVASWDLPLDVAVVDQPAPRGTADALAAALPLVGHDRFVYHWGDVLTPPGLVADVVVAASETIGAIAVSRVDEVADGSDVVTEDGWVTEITEKPTRRGPGWNASGVGCLPADAWDLIGEVRPSSRGELELTDVLSRLSRMRRLRAVPVRGRVIDIGTPERLIEARAAMSETD